MKKLIILLLPILLLAGCRTSPAGSYSNDITSVESTQLRVQKSVPIPVITTSAERKNISARATLFNNENKITYIYLVNFGKVMAFFTVQGKVSSLNSYLTPTDKLVDADGNNCGDYNIRGAYCAVVSAPDIDGAYGENADGIFFFTTEGVYVEWKGDYMVSDQPLKLTTAPELVRNIQ